jgi:hypothetical protein
MRNIIINGLCRSGNHAITFWMMHNLVDELTKIEDGIYKDSLNKVLYINNVGRKPREYQLVSSIIYEKYNYLFRSYEDSYYNKHSNIIILRDFINMLSSRYKKYGPNIGLNQTYICNINSLISVWKQHAKAKNKQIIIKYNDWIKDKEYRNFIANKINIPNIRDNYKYISEIGQGSSFDNKDNNYINRYKNIKLPKYIIDCILIDLELIEMNKTLFNLDIQDMINI